MVVQALSFVTAVHCEWLMLTWRSAVYSWKSCCRSSPDLTAAKAARLDSCAWTVDHSLSGLMSLSLSMTCIQDIFGCIHDNNTVMTVSMTVTTGMVMMLRTA